MLTEMELTESFDASIRVPPITTIPAIDHVLREVDLFGSEREQRRCVEMLNEAGWGKKVGQQGVGVKKLLGLVEMARQGEERERCEIFVGGLVELSS